MAAKTDLAPLLTLIVLMEFGLWVFFGFTAVSTVLLDLIVDGLNGGSDFIFLEWVLDNIGSVIALAGVATIVVGTLIATERTLIIWGAPALAFSGYIYIFPRFIREIHHFSMIL